MGLTGFGIALVAMAFLPWLMEPATAIIVLTVYALVFSLVVMVQLRRDVTPRALADLFAAPALAGALVGIALFGRLDAAVFRRIVFALLLVSGLLLLVRG